ncbi:Predicted 5' DNA nuclease, flap endonuclease-1-like, helix-3-turn-helix (H3TH) domain [Yoonia tamlensis]|uniref:Predicted 5' DNA nuclease, flap endonuclease-1-like, helix-3-turn-helix (H3TH) domain n=1 Tax=Yoonia tamlensis TaxID=390270 RepID=A0A1I6GJJ4_9RHOB|nr:NADH:ubiquinone oxidoreductase [Yoonia tamlensis]SFR42316.1 Predicted 5' DNA nuclease, flap endonuclease-1-like, helix-3-turn-helix (H3TH) domain [Yoonia tamlensis]
MNDLKPMTQRMLTIAGGTGIVFAILLLLFSKIGFFGALLIGALVAAAILFAMMLGLLDALVGEDSPTSAPPVISDTPVAAAPEPKTAVAPEAAPEPAPAPMPEPAVAPTSSPEPVVSAGKPATLDAARAEGADDLKKIKGVGPKLEVMLNEMGFYHFDQVAAWGAAEQKWVDENLPGFKGRATRDKWVEQAKTLAAG